MRAQEAFQIVETPDHLYLAFAVKFQGPEIPLGLWYCVVPDGRVGVLRIEKDRHPFLYLEETEPSGDHGLLIQQMLERLADKVDLHRAPSFQGAPRFRPTTRYDYRGFPDTNWIMEQVCKIGPMLSGATRGAPTRC